MFSVCRYLSSRLVWTLPHMSMAQLASGDIGRRPDFPIGLALLGGPRAISRASSSNGRTLNGAKRRELRYLETIAPLSYFVVSVTTWMTDDYFVVHHGHRRLPRWRSTRMARQRTLLDAL